MMTRHEIKTGTLAVRKDGGHDLHFDKEVIFIPGQRWAMTLALLPDMDALRRLRLWHWRESLRLRGTPEAGQHVRAVQTLNDLFPIMDTAERDDAAETAVRVALHLPA